jgi:hypothetical protein
MSKAFYGDNDGSRVFAIDLDSWSSVEISTGDGPYPVDRISASDVLASTRRVNAVTRIGIAAPNQTDTIQLTHMPRSATAHPNGQQFVLISGADQVCTTVLDLSASSGDPMVVGSRNTAAVADFGGRLRTGHPAWLDADTDRFMELDRVTRTINIYEVGDERPIVSLSTPTSVHEIARLPGEKGRWYAVCEGQRSSISPSLFIFEERNGGFSPVANIELPIPVAGRTQMGGHHVDTHPNGRMFYFGSAEGNVYLIDPATENVEHILETGAGHGHTRVAAKRGLAISTNHDDSFVTVWDTATDKKVRDIEVSYVPASAEKKRQAHTSAISPDGKYYYSAASTDGIFYAIDLDSLEVAKTLRLGGYPIQGTFIWTP